MTDIVGIDLGTTHSLIGIMDSGFPILLADAEGQRLTPSVVHFSTTGEVTVGRAAARQRVLDPANTIFSVKRVMGRRVDEQEMEVPWEVAGAPGDPVRIRAGGREHRPEEVSALILRKLKADAERALGREVSRAVITVPAYFHDAQRQATKAAGELAGFMVERIVSEPTAAALAYGLDRLGENSRVAVYDFGGGTFDISILELSAGVFHVIATQGHTRLGGDDIDDALVSACELAISDAQKLEVVQQAKCRLSTEEAVEIPLPFAKDGESLVYRMSRAELERIARPIVERTRGHCLRALADAKIAAAELDAVVLVGGQTRMPMVRRLVSEIFGREPDISQHPDEAVAIGATIQAAVLAGVVHNVVLLDVTPLSLGIETFGGLMNVLIPRNTTIPAKAGEMFTNAMAGQAGVLVKILQGEREMAKDNWVLGEFELPFEPMPKGQARVGVQFEIDADGILHVLVRDTKTGAEKTMEVSSAVKVEDAAVEQMVGDSVEHAFEDMNDRIFTEAKLKADEMLPAVAQGLVVVGEMLSDEERHVIDAKVQEVQDALGSRDAQRLKRACAALDEATETLAALLIEKLM